MYLSPSREVIEHIFTHHTPKPEQLEKYQQIRDKAKEFALLIAEIVPSSREQYEALTRLEDVAFWANAGIARNK